MLRLRPQYGMFLQPGLQGRETHCNETDTDYSYDDNDDDDTGSNGKRVVVLVKQFSH